MWSSGEAVLLLTRNGCRNATHRSSYSCSCSGTHDLEQEQDDHRSPLNVKVRSCTHKGCLVRLTMRGTLRYDHVLSPAQRAGFLLARHCDIIHKVRSNCPNY